MEIEAEYTLQYKKAWKKSEKNGRVGLFLRLIYVSNESWKNGGIYHFVEQILLYQTVYYSNRLW